MDEEETYIPTKKEVKKMKKGHKATIRDVYKKVKAKHRATLESQGLEGNDLENQATNQANDQLAELIPDGYEDSGDEDDKKNH